MNSFPNQDLERIFSVAFGADLTADPSTWAFTDLSSRVLPNLINIRRAASVGAQNTATTLATITCTNDDGALTPRLATSPYFPYVDSGTPAQLAIRDRSDLTATFTAPAVTNGWPNADTGEVWTPGTASAFSSNGTQGLITFPAINVSRSIRSTRTERDVDVVFDSSLSAVALGTAEPVGVVVRSSGGGLYKLFCHVNFGLSGALGLQVRRYYNSTGSSTTLAAVTLGSTYSAGTMVRTRVQVFGNRIRARAWLAAGAEPSTWDIDITQTGTIVNGWNAALTATDFIAMRADILTGTTNTLPVIVTFDNITIAQIASNRIRGYIADVRPTYLPVGDGTFTSTVQIDIAGVGSRTEKKDAPALSPMRRSVEKSSPPPIAYWPCEDAEGSTVAVSAFPGQGPMVVTGPATFAFTGGAVGVPEAQYQSRFGSKPMISLAAGAKLTGLVPVTAVQNEWAVSLVSQFDVSDVVPAITELRVAEWTTAGGTHNRWALIGTTNGYVVRAYNDAAGTFTDVITTTPAFSGNYQLTFTVEAAQNGGNIDVALRFNDNAGGTGSVAGTLAAPNWVFANPDRANVTASITPTGLTFIVGQIRVVNDVAVRDLPFYVDAEQGGLVVYAGNAWFHETAHGRAGRLSDEERVPFVLLGDPATTGMTILNAQPDGTYTSLMTDTVESESGGLLFESEFGYAMIPRTTRYNQSPALVIDMSTYARSDGTSAADVLVPQLDPRLPNVITVQRRDGAEGTFAADEAYRSRRGTITQGYVLDVLTDDDPREHAAWREHVNVDAQDAFYPGCQVDLAANPGLIDSWLSCDIGSRIQRTNQPTIAGTGIVDQVILGIAEVIGPRTWLATTDCAPASVWDVAVYDDASRRKDSASTVTNASYAPGVTTIVFKTANVGDLWSTTYTYDCECVGERFTVTAMGAATGSGPYLQSATVIRAVNGAAKTLPAGAEIHMHLDQLARYAL